jgi:hypothetical protein
VSPHPKLEPKFSIEQAALALLLIIGMYVPTSTDGENSSHPMVFVAFFILFSLLTYLAWKHGIRPGVAAFISLPIMIVLAGCTICAYTGGSDGFDFRVFTRFSALALILALDLRRFRLGPLVNSAFVLVNLLNIACGVAILVGSEWIAEFLPKYYWSSYFELLHTMLMLRKPVLTFGIHSLAAFFLYLFFWVNWENYKVRRSTIYLIFTMSYFILLLALTSFSSAGLGALAMAQMGMWSWERNRKIVIAVALSVAAIIPFAVRTFADEIDALTELPQLAETAFLNADLSGPLARFGPDGSLRPAVTYLLTHPLLPVGFAPTTSAFDMPTPSHFFIGDSGPLEYLLRGSAPLLFLVYFGLYRFLRSNLASRSHVITLFLVIIAFETGYSALGSTRTFFLLPFFVVYLNQIASAQPDPRLQEIVPNRSRSVPSEARA